MKFERGKDIKSAIGIGSFRNAPEVVKIYFNKNGDFFELTEDQFMEVYNTWKKMNPDPGWTPVAEIKFPAYSNIKRKQGSADKYVILFASPWDIEFDLVSPLRPGSKLRARAKDLMSEGSIGIPYYNTEDPRKIKLNGKCLELPKLNKDGF